ncbi:MAG TPA: hypothetical protein VEX86_10065 [Longimicrobium sp.]|nr:hypothetical protein [Longimicrobium sp.]
MTVNSATGEVTKIEHLERDRRRREFTLEEYTAASAYTAGAPTGGSAARGRPTADPAGAAVAFDPYGYLRPAPGSTANATNALSKVASGYTPGHLAYLQGARDAAAAFGLTPAALAYYQALAAASAPSPPAPALEPD